MGNVVRILPNYTYDDYIHWEGKCIPYAIAPLPLPKHQRIAAALNYEFIGAIKKAKCKPVSFIIRLIILQGSIRYHNSGRCFNCL